MRLSFCSKTSEYTTICRICIVANLFFFFSLILIKFSTIYDNRIDGRTDGRTNRKIILLRYGSIRCYLTPFSTPNVNQKYLIIQLRDLGLFIVTVRMFVNGEIIIQCSIFSGNCYNIELSLVLRINYWW